MRSENILLPGPGGLGRAKGFTYVGVLFLVLLLGLGLAGTFESWAVASQRARERDLLWVGNQYARALQSYFRQSPPGMAQYPRRLEDLVEDNRFPVPRRHLRRLYPDPVTRSLDWGLVKTPDGRIAGVYSPSDAPPLKRANFPLRWEEFNDREKYSEWRFIADAGVLAGKVPGRPQPGRRPGAP